MDDLYQEHIVDHYKNPRNFGEIKSPTHQGKGANASCGDMVHMYVNVEGEKMVEIQFKSIGCALSTAAASMLTEKIGHEKTTVKEIMGMSTADVVELLGIEVSPTRQKCVELPLRTLQDILKKGEE